MTTVNAFRIPWLMKPASAFYTWYMRTIKKRLKTPIGGNMGLWRSDMLAVNGYDEDFEGWGYEDADIGFRLRNRGLELNYIKLGANMYHLYHTPNSRANTENNRLRTMQTIEQGKLRCDNGIDKYLKD